MAMPMIIKIIPAILTNVLLMLAGFVIKKRPHIIISTAENAEEIQSFELIFRISIALKKLFTPDSRKKIPMIMGTPIERNFGKMIIKKPIIISMIDFGIEVEYIPFEIPTAIVIML